MKEKERLQGKTIQLQYGLNDEEYRLPGTNYRVDGYDENNRTIYEFHVE